MRSPVISGRSAAWLGSWIGMVGWLGLAIIVPTSSSATYDRTVTVKLFPTTISFKLRDNPPKGTVGAGDVIVDKSRLRNAVGPQFGRPVGAVVGEQVALLKMNGRKTGRISLTIGLPGGTLIAQGALRWMSTGDLGPVPVVAGKGHFAGARGTVTTRTVGKEKSLQTFSLRLP